MKQFLKKNWLLALILAGSILLITILVITTRAPEPITSTEYDFVYTQSDSVWFLEKIEADTYIVENQKIVAVPGRHHSAQSLWLYDSTNQKSRQLSLEEAEKLTIDSNELSPDGFIVAVELSKEPITWGDNSDYLRFLVFKKDNQSTQIKISHCLYEEFVGWVIK